MGFSPFVTAQDSAIAVALGASKPIVAAACMLAQSKKRQRQFKTVASLEFKITLQLAEADYNSSCRQLPRSGRPETRLVITAVVLGSTTRVEYYIS